MEISREKLSGHFWSASGDGQGFQKSSSCGMNKREREKNGDRQRRWRNGKTKKKIDRSDPWPEVVDLPGLDGERLSLACMDVLCTTCNAAL